MKDFLVRRYQGLGTSYLVTSNQFFKNEVLGNSYLEASSQFFRDKVLGNSLDERMSLHNDEMKDERVDRYEFRWTGSQFLGISEQELA